jgi:hypothetical protein
VLGTVGAAIASSAAYTAFAVYSVLQYRDMTGVPPRSLFFDVRAAEVATGVGTGE